MKNEMQAVDMLIELHVTLLTLLSEEGFVMYVRVLWKWSHAPSRCDRQHPLPKSRHVNNRRALSFGRGVCPEGTAVPLIALRSASEKM